MSPHANQAPGGRWASLDPSTAVMLPVSHGPVSILISRTIFQ